MLNKQQIENLQVRYLKDEDINFIYNSFLKSLKHAFSSVPSEIYFNHLKLVLLKILERATVLVVHLKEDPNKILGYLIYERIKGIYVLHYVYVKHVYRNLKIASGLIKSSGYRKDEESGIASFPIKKGEFSFFEKFNINYDPFILYEGVKLGGEKDDKN